MHKGSGSAEDDPSLAILITGVSKGMGRALALELGRRGHTIIGCSRTQNHLDSLRTQLSAISHSSQHNHLLLTVDVTSNSSLEGLVRAVLDTNLVPDILLNNAGMINEKSKFWEIPSDKFDCVIDTNIKGTANVLRHFIPHMIEREKRIIVNISSSMGRTGAPMFSPYSASKWAIEGLTKSIAQELPKGMAIIALHPGIVSTDIVVSSMGDLAAKNYPKPEEWAVKASTRILNFTAADNGASLSVDFCEEWREWLQNVGESQLN